jgi:hypothetical protein
LGSYAAAARSDSASSATRRYSFDVYSYGALMRKASGLGLGRACSSIRATHNSETAVIASACGRSDAQLISYALLHPSKRRAQLAQYDSHSRVHSLHLNQLGVQLQPIGPIAGRNRRKTRRMGLATRAVQSKLWRNDKEHSTLRCEAAPAIQQWPGRSKQLHASACARKSGTLGSRDVAIPLFALCLTAGRRLQALFRTHHHSIAQPLLQVQSKR